MSSGNGGSSTAVADDKHQDASIPDTSDKVTESRKRPPPEAPEATRLRTLVILSFWAVILFLGLPMWWKTTSIYRATLPIGEIMEWADGKACRPEFPLQIAVHAPSVPNTEARHLIQTTQHALDDLNELSAHHLRLQLAETLEDVRNGSQGISTPELVPLSKPEDVVLTVRLLPREDVATPSSTLQPYTACVDIFYSPGQIPSTSSSISPLATFIANELQALFTEEQATIAYILSLNSPAGASQQSLVSSTSSSQASTSGNREQRKPGIKSVSPDLENTIARRTARSFKYSPTYHLTFSLFTPGASPSSWDISESLEEYISPVLSAFSSISDFTVDTQVQLYASFAPSAPQPTYDDATRSWYLQKEDLSAFINAAEWPLSPSIGAGPTINFVLYVPSASQTPLRIQGTESTSWLIPQWGSIFILNPTSEDGADGTDGTAPLPINPAHMTLPSLRPAFATFTSHLLSLLGVPSTPATSLPLRLSTLTRIHTLTLLQSSSSTLGSLARLTKTLSSIPIPLSVSNAVTDTLSHLRQTCDNLQQGRFDDALGHARIAEAKAEGAFFEKSMVGQVYFPDEHKVAIYLPLLGPIGVPLVMSLVKEIKRWVRKLKS